MQLPDAPQKSYGKRSRWAGVRFLLWGKKRSLSMERRPSGRSLAPAGWRPARGGRKLAGGGAALRSHEKPCQGRASYQTVFHEVRPLPCISRSILPQAGLSLASVYAGVRLAGRPNRGTGGGRGGSWPHKENARSPAALRRGQSSRLTPQSGIL